MCMYFLKRFLHEITSNDHHRIEREHPALPKNKWKIKQWRMKTEFSISHLSWEIKNLKQTSTRGTLKWLLINICTINYKHDSTKDFNDFSPSIEVNIVECLNMTTTWSFHKILWSTKAWQNAVIFSSSQK